VDDLLPDPEPFRLLDDGPATTGTPPSTATPVDCDKLLDLYRRMATGRRLDQQATLLANQGRLSAYPSSVGQEAVQVGAVDAMRTDDWLFPTYRDSIAMVNRGIDPFEVFTVFRGDRHCGYDAREHRTAPACTPLATHAPHATGLAYAARRRGDAVVAVVIVGDAPPARATSTRRPTSRRCSGCPWCS
jgi:pyruvate dehydrogenase E1 component alpha subunit